MVSFAVGEGFAIGERLEALRRSPDDTFFAASEIFDPDG